MNLHSKPRNEYEHKRYFPCDIPEQAIKNAKAAAIRKNVSESSILVSTVVELVRQYTGCDKISLLVRLADSFTTITVDLTSATRIGDLFRHLHLQLAETVCGSPTIECDIEIELPGSLMRPLMHFNHEIIETESSILFRYESDENRAKCEFICSGEHYPVELFPQMARHFINILSDVVERPEARINDIVMIDAEEIAEIIERGSGPEVKIERKCAHQFFEEQAAKNPEAIALICGKQKLSYRDLNDKANVIGHRLQSLGVGPESIVGIGMERSIEAVICILAVFKAGGAYTIIDPGYPTARVKEMLSDAQASLVITKSSFNAGSDYENLEIIDYNQFADYPKENTVNVVSDVTVDNAAYITFTSGSTGKPKGIIGIHLSITTLLDFSKFFYEKNAANEVCCLLSPLSFGAAVGAIFLPLCCGIPLVIIPNGEEKDPYKFGCYISEYGITNFVATPALVRQLCGLNDEGRKLLNSVKRVGIGGAAVTPDLVRAVKQVIPQAIVSSGYSGSEIGLAAFGRFIEDADLKDDERISLGKPGPNTQTYILDGEGKIVPIGVPGELYVSSPYLSRGYTGMPELTMQRFLSNPFTNSVEFSRMYRTGDILRYRFDGEVEYIGRADSEVKIRGFRIEIEEIESLLRNHDAIEEAVVTIDIGKYSERLVAWVVRKPETDTEIPELRRHIKKYLPDYMVPSVFIFMKQLPLNANGKIDRTALSFDATEHAASSEGREMPRNQLESAVADIWRKMLEQEVGIHDDFLDLGGDSIQAGLISLEIRERFNVEIPIIMFFEDLTVAKLAEDIYQIQKNSD